MDYKTCEVCDKPFSVDCPPHHFVHKSELSKREKSLPKFLMDLCPDCHWLYHFKIGVAVYYRKVGLIQQLTGRCHYDPRWLKRLAGFGYKVNIKALCNHEHTI